MLITVKCSLNFFLFFPFFKINFFFFLLYNIVLVLPYINMNLPQVYTCSPSQTPLPPTSLYHPSGSSQCTSPKLPVSCIEPGDSISYMILYMFQCHSPKSSHPWKGDLFHRVQKTILYICVSLAVSLTGLSLPSF